MRTPIIVSLLLSLSACDGPPSFVVGQDGGPPSPDLGPSPDLAWQGDGAAADQTPDLSAPDTRPSAYAMVLALTAPAMTGRKSGTPGGTLAADYIAERLAACGVQPYGDTPGSYRQTFKVTPIVHTGKMALTVHFPGAAAHSFPYRQQWRCGRTSPGADLSAALVFAGYGLAEAQHDDYKGIDVKGKVVLVLRGCPPINGIKGCDDLAKVAAAHKQKAAALVLVADNDGQVDIWGGSQGQTLLAIPAALIKPGPADTLLPAGKSLGALRAALNSAGPGSFDTGATIKLLMSRTAVKDADAHNMLGIIPALSPKSTPSYVVAGAHYDHLGFDEPPHNYFPGALDNASGTAVVIDAACRLARQVGAARTRAVVVGLWAAEEDGLIGSRFFVDSGRINLAATRVAFNLDMVGGTGHGPLRVTMSPNNLPALEQLIKPLLASLPLPVTTGPITSGGSDHVNFIAKGVPTYYFVGPHPQPLYYHTAADTSVQLSPDALDQLGRLLARAVDAAAR